MNINKSQDLTVVYYTANLIGERFAEAVRTLIKDTGLPIVSVSHKPIDFGINSVVDLPVHTLSIYKQALIGAKEAKTPYIALCEDDVFYSPKHFEYRPTDGKFAYNIGHWGVHTWDPRFFSWRGRRQLSNLICQRDLFIEAMEERFAKHGDDVDLSIFSEPGKYERNLGVTVRETETFWSNPPNIVFSHDKALSFAHLGTRKRFGTLLATEIPYWGRVEKIAGAYEKV